MLVKTEDITKAVSILVSILIAAGLLNQIVYYKFFNVQIAEFLNAGEILLLFADDLLFYLMVMMTTITVVALLPSFRDNKVTAFKERRRFIRYVKTEEAFERLIFFFTQRWVGILLWTTSLTVLYFTDKEFFNISIYVFSFEMCIWLLRWHSYEIRRSMRIKDELTKQDETLYTSFSILLFFLLILLIYTVYDVRDVRDKQKFINTSIVVSDQAIKSDSNYFYIGKTDDFVFFYNKKKDETTVYPMEQVERINFGKVVYWQLEEPREKETPERKEKKWWNFW
jgi:hypothetical protein